jgi:hypothetical protein
MTVATSDACRRKGLLCALVGNEISDVKGDVMKKHYLKIFLALVGFAGLSGIAKAQSREMVVTLPFEFVASGKTLPAGTYTVTRISEDNFGDLLLSNQAKHVSVLVHPIEVESVRADKPSVGFERVGESRFLTRIATEDNVYNIAVSGVAIIDESARKANDAMRSSASGSN